MYVFRLLVVSAMFAGSSLGAMDFLDDAAIEVRDQFRRGLMVRLQTRRGERDVRREIAELEKRQAQIRREYAQLNLVELESGKASTARKAQAKASDLDVESSSIRDTLVVVRGALAAARADRGAKKHKAKSKAKKKRKRAIDYQEANSPDLV